MQHEHHLPRAAAQATRVSLVAAGLILSACGGGGTDDAAGAGATTPTSGAPSASTTVARSATHSGEGTYYGATGAGNCSFDPSPDNLMVAAMNHTDYAGSAACGEYVAVTGPKGTLTLRIVDQCPECRPGDIDLSAEAFARI